MALHIPKHAYPMAIDGRRALQSRANILKSFFKDRHQRVVPCFALEPTGQGIGKSREFDLICIVSPYQIVLKFGGRRHFIFKATPFG